MRGEAIELKLQVKCLSKLSNLGVPVRVWSSVGCRQNRRWVELAGNV